ncbi:hypothetical protein ACKI1I_10875 [Streptomyces turgidiscabies]|uniref:Uncharacterized protein n=1 Tax=Streptomyces turgidiscabies (strain Car8) TaxID=698760 RepID=L7F6T3_STRT8|nr:MULTISPECIES: hypothetical protein [Streptomyces]ELP66741.1 hypothetical protein STRTUCAR8_03111 [Streptomyces turgidiscabies Car8]MDX3499937.1 hypothetical protein [Streptomyces turgidiscabies]GAQ76976.1 hypothetical protein T45_08788 [Streptomyces turgidiscabies]
MGTLIISAIVVLIIMGFKNSVLWLAAAGLLYVYFRYGRTGSGTAASSSGGGGGPAPGSSPASYRAYRQRRDQQARWERRYSRERPLQNRRRDRKGR